MADLIGFSMGGEVDEVDPAEAHSYDAAVNAFLESPALELWGYREYVENQSPFATQQGIKGAEFQRVLVVLDDEEGDYNLFSYGKYFGITALSKIDNENIAAGADSAISRTRRLFYVCCSRATKDLAVVWFVPDVQQARRAALAKDIFLEHDIHVIGE
jgi:DNA helicase-2/ATP-dependent DNA helicase PcrA